MFSHYLPLLWSHVRKVQKRRPAKEIVGVIGENSAKIAPGCE